MACEGAQLGIWRWDSPWGMGRSHGCKGKGRGAACWGGEDELIRVEIRFRLRIKKRLYRVGCGLTGSGLGLDPNR